MGVEPKHTTKPKCGRRKDLLLAASKENTRDCSPEQQHSGRFKLRVDADVRGLE